MIKFVLFFPFVYLMSLSGFGQPFTFNTGKAAIPNYYSEISYQNINGKIIIPVTIRGKSHRFLFDTGAPVAISPKLAGEMSMLPIHKGLLRDVNGSADSSEIVLIDKLFLGDVCFEEIPALKFLPDIYRCWGVEGVIGSNILRGSIIQILSRSKKIILTDQIEKLILDKKPGMPLLLDQNNERQSMPYINLAVTEKVDLLISFDTGDNDFLRFSEELMRKLYNRKAYQVISSGYGSNSIGAYGLSSYADKYLLKFPTLKIGPVIFKNVFTETQKNGLPGLGAKLFDYGDVTIDFIHHRFYYDAFTKTLDLKKKRWPFEPTIIDDKLIVGLVWKKALNLVRPGEQITLIDGKDYSQINFCDVLNGPSILAGKDYANITVKDKSGQLRNITIIKK